MEWTAIFSLHLSFREPVVREEEAFKLNFLEDLEDFSGLGKDTCLQRRGTLQQTSEKFNFSYNGNHLCFLPVYLCDEILRV